MNLYNMVFGDGKKGLPLLAELGLTQIDQIPRYRDAWIDKTDDGVIRIAVYTRAGGGNRDDYQEVIDSLRNNPYYLSDADDDFDCTYATFYFSFPPHLAPIFDRNFPEWRDHVKPPVDMSEVWINTINSIGENTNQTKDNTES